MVCGRGFGTAPFMERHPSIPRSKGNPDFRDLSADAYCSTASHCCLVEFACCVSCRGCYMPEARECVLGSPNQSGGSSIGLETGRVHGIGWRGITLCELRERQV